MHTTKGKLLDIGTDVELIPTLIKRVGLDGSK